MGKAWRREEALVLPEVEAMEGAGDVPHLAQHRGAGSHVIRHPLQVEEAAVALDVQLVQHLSCPTCRVLAQSGLAVQLEQDVLLHVPHRSHLPHVIQAQEAEAWGDAG